MAKEWRTINLELGMPTVTEAQKRLFIELLRAREDGMAVVMLIHGYGSSGVGGRIREAVRQSLARMKKEGQIAAYVCGEEWSIFDQTTRDILDACPDLKKSPDLERGNRGITFVLL
ncbi:MAG: hypothetical protein PWP65_1417 [Clostridia bacterium]|nr:hypothetical protein [Clostridia bacterium]